MTTDTEESGLSLRLFPVQPGSQDDRVPGGGDVLSVSAAPSLAAAAAARGKFHLPLPPRSPPPLNQAAVKSDAIGNLGFSLCKLRIGSH